MMDLPIILVPVGADDAALDRCLAALDDTTPAGTRKWLADDACAGPRGLAIIDRWLAKTTLRADYTRRQRQVGEVAHLDEALKACGESDVIVLASDTVPLMGWANQLAACFARDASIATATPWCNAGESAAWPRSGAPAPFPKEPERLAQAVSNMSPAHPELPAAGSHAVALRGNARKRVGGLDATSYGSWYAALIDLSLRLSGLGWRNALCETAFVACHNEGRPADGDFNAFAIRWPAWHARAAGFLMDDPLRDIRQALSDSYARTDPIRPQRDLFAQCDADVIAIAADALLA